MPRLTINGEPCEVPEGTTLLAASRGQGIDLPVLCHDERIAPSGACRLCVVEVEGWDRYPSACNTPAADGMTVRTHSAGVEQDRRMLLRLLAREYPAAAMEASPDQPFHRLLRDYGVSADGTKAPSKLFRDASHPWLRVDMTQCITCFRCIRICDELQGQFVWRAWDRGDATRIRPDSGDSLEKSSCVSCGACADTCPTGAIQDQSVFAEGVADQWTRTTCPYCGTGCEMTVGTKGGRIVQVKPVPDAPVNKGHLCVKGRYAFGFVHARDRVTEPMVRRHGDWQVVSWEEATRVVADRFGRILEESGPSALGVLGSARATNEENYLAQKFARVVLGTNNVDCCARVCHAPTAAGMKAILGTGAATNSFDDIERAETVLICGCNPTENHPIVGARIKQAVLRGAQLVVVDPREIELARYAAVHLQLRPGTNIPLLNALAHVIVTEGLVDETSLRERVDGYENFRRFIAAWTPERAGTICEVSPGSIRQAARLYAAHPPSICFHGLGMTEHVQGTEGVMCLVNLALLTGNFGKPGTGVNPLRGQNNVQGSAHMGCEPGSLTGFVPIDQGRDLFESVWQAPVPRSKGFNLMEMIDAAGAGDLRALWAIGYDIALTNPETRITHEALAKLDFIVVQDMFLNEVAREFGSIFLPACSSFEKEGTFMNSERRVQRVRRALPPIGGSRPDWEIICGVAAAMGHRRYFDFDSPEKVWNEIRRVWAAGEGITYGRLEKSGLQWPCPSENHPGTTVLHEKTFPHGKTAPLKEINFQPSAETTLPEFPFLLTTGRTLHQFNAGTMTMRTPGTRLRPADTLDISPQDAARLELCDGEHVRVRSRHGQTFLPVRFDPRLSVGRLFATFHTAEASLNLLTGPGRDKKVLTPEYKVIAVHLDKVAMDENHRDMPRPEA